MSRALRSTAASLTSRNKAAASMSCLAVASTLCASGLGQAWKPFLFITVLPTERDMHARVTGPIPGAMAAEVVNAAHVMQIP